MSLTPGGVNQDAPASSLERDLPRVRGVLEYHPDHPGRTSMEEEVDFARLIVSERKEEDGKDKGRKRSKSP